MKFADVLGAGLCCLALLAGRAWWSADAERRASLAARCVVLCELDEEPEVWGTRWCYCTRTRVLDLEERG